MTKKLQTQTLNLLIDYEDKTSFITFFLNGLLKQAAGNEN
jgi:hypothetical protein